MFDWRVFVWVRTVPERMPYLAWLQAAVVMLGFMLVGGFYVRNIPDWIGWLKWVSFMTYGYNLVLKVGGHCFCFPMLTD